MTPEATHFLDKANKLLGEADTMLRVGLNEAAGRTAYLAGFHVAQAFIFERLANGVKTHNGVHTEFLRLTKDDPRVDPALRTPRSRGLSQAYSLKAIADYETGPGSEVSTERAASAVADGKRFVAHFAPLVPKPNPGNGPSAAP